MGTVFLYILIISFFATLVRSTLGFGESLVAVPLFSIVIPIETAVPLSVLISVLVALVVVIQDHKQIHLYSAKWLSCLFADFYQAFFAANMWLTGRHWSSMGICGNGLPKTSGPRSRDIFYPPVLSG
jgi:uncharacterized membrane protein YfcA